ncbi:hypothetical protein H9P43_009025 [Blastocladiella emersonii ATCC 22665]|nr:hypothetical protein H9P43_009025 [Blastocladiella emersonii ATCC 22665]
MTNINGPTEEIWANIARKGENITVRVKALGQVGDGKSTFCNDFVEFYDKDGNFAEVFETSDGVESVVSGGKTSPVNPLVLPPNVTMYIQDGDGFGGLGKKIEDVTEENLRDIKATPAVLLVVASALRGPVALINQLQLLKIVSDINERNCFLVLTKAGRSGNPRTRQKPQQAAEYDPTEYLAQLAKHGVNFFEVGRNVACIDLGDRDEMRYVTIECIRAAVCDLRPLIVRETYSELMATAEGNLESLTNDRETSLAMIEELHRDKAWHSQRIQNLSIATASTALIPLAGQIAGVAMAVVIKNSNERLTQIDHEVKHLKEKLVDTERQRKDAAERLAQYKSLIQEVKKAEDMQR